MYEVLFITSNTPTEKLLKSITYPWHQLAQDLSALGLHVRVCAPLKFIRPEKNARHLAERREGAFIHGPILSEHVA